MNRVSKDIFLSNDQTVPADRANWESYSFGYKRCDYQGKSYEIHKICSRNLSVFERVESGLKGLIAVIATLGIALIFSSAPKRLLTNAMISNNLKQIKDWMSNSCLRKRKIN